MQIAYLSTALALVLIMSCSSGVQPKPSISFDETRLSENSSKMKIKSDLNRSSVVQKSFSLMCTISRLTVNRGFKYFYIDERRKPEDRQPSFRLTFYKSAPEGIPVINPMDAHPGEGPDPMSSAIDAKAYIEACKLNESQRMK